jgi:hypothetical protein
MLSVNTFTIMATSGLCYILMTISDDHKSSLYYKCFIGPNLSLSLCCQSGMSEIRDRAKTAPVKSQKFLDTGFPVSGKKFRLVPLKLPVSSGQE